MGGQAYIQAYVEVAVPKEVDTSPESELVKSIANEMCYAVDEVDVSAIFDCAKELGFVLVPTKPKP